MNFEWKRFTMPNIETGDLDEMPADFARFLEIRASVDHPQHKPEFTGQDDIYRALDACEDPEMALYYCQNKRQRVVGSMVLDMSARYDDAYWLDTLAVDPCLRQSGIGRAGINLAAHDVIARNDGREYIQGNAVTDAVEFYQHCGFFRQGLPGSIYTPIRGHVDDILRYTGEQN